MADIELIAIREECARHVARTGYPADLPALPDIPAARYSDPRLFELEMKHVWGTSWLMAAHESEIAQPGTYKLFDQIGESIIISRGTDNIVRAFHNICRHRAAPLVKEPAGKAPRFLCPYHSWSYATDGALIAVPEERNFPCLDRGERGLLPVRCESWRGFVFVNLDGDATPLASYIEPVARRCEDFPFERMEVKRHCRIEVEANWKTVFDNFIEAYHISTVHPAIARWLEPRSFAARPLRNGHSYFKVQRKNRNRIVAEDARTPPGSFDRFEEYAINLPIFPNIAGALDVAGFVWETFWPAGPGKTIVDIPLFGWVGNDDAAYWDAVMAENVRLLGEDLAILPGVDRAARSGRLAGMMISCQEQGIYWYHEEIDRKIGVENVPPELRIEPVLAAHMLE